MTVPPSARLDTLLREDPGARAQMASSRAQVRTPLSWPQKLAGSSLV